MFKTLRKGAQLYILDRTEEPEVKIGYIDNVSMPRPMYPTYNPAVSLGTNMQTVVDLTVKLGEETKEFVVPSDLTIHSYGGYTISENKEAMISEVDSLLRDDEEAVAGIEKKKANIPIYKKILGELNPVFAKEQERDDAIDSLTKLVDGIQNTLKRLETLLLGNTGHDNN